MRPVGHAVEPIVLYKDVEHFISNDFTRIYACRKQSEASTYPVPEFFEADPGECLEMFDS